MRAEHPSCFIFAVRISRDLRLEFTISAIFVKIKGYTIGCKLTIHFAFLKTSDWKNAETLISERQFFPNKPVTGFTRPSLKINFKEYRYIFYLFILIYNHILPRGKFTPCAQYGSCSHLQQQPQLSHLKGLVRF